MRKNVFHFENFLFDYEGCHRCVSNAWTEDNFVYFLLSFSSCVARTRANIIKWKAAGFRTIDGEIKNIEQEFSLIETADPSHLEMSGSMSLQSPQCSSSSKFNVLGSKSSNAMGD